MTFIIKNVSVRYTIVYQQPMRSIFSLYCKTTARYCRCHFASHKSNGTVHTLIKAPANCPVAYRAFGGPAIKVCPVTLFVRLLISLSLLW